MNTFIQRNFAAGELDPALNARADMSKYMTGARTVRNFMVMRQGGLTNRPGTGYVTEVKTGSKRVKYLSFEYVSGVSFLIELGDQYIRFHKDGVPVYDAAKTITGITSGATTVVTSAAHGLTNGQQVDISGIVGMSDLNGRAFVVASVTTNTFELKTKAGASVDSSGFGAYASGGVASRVYELVTPYLEEHLQDIKYHQIDQTITITHRLYKTRELTRVTDSAWTLTELFFIPSLAGPTGLSGVGTGLAKNHSYIVTAVSFTYEEGLPSAAYTLNADAPTASAPITLNWTAVAGAREYNVYKAQNGVYGFLGISGVPGFTDIGYEPDTSDTPTEGVIPAPPADGTDGHYSNVGSYQQRRLLMKASEPNLIVASQIKHFKNLQTKSPPQADNAIFHYLSGRKMNEVKHAVDIGALAVLTNVGEWVTPGDTPITATEGMGLRQHSYYGSSDLPPIVMGGNLLYVQAKRSIVRDFGFDYQIDGYRGNDLTVFSAHLLKHNTIVDWAYQQNPHSIVWMVRNDGTLIGLTYLREHDILGWHRHDTDGFVENIICISEENEDVIYLCVRRTINGEVTRFIERMKNRNEEDLTDLVLMDSAKTYDGRNSSATTMTISGGTLWDDSEALTCTASASAFTSLDVGKTVVFPGDFPIKFTIEGYTSSTVVTGKVQATLPVALRNIATTDWSLAIKKVSGLWHLEGKDVAIFADSLVVASPNNSDYAKVTVENGSITLPQAYSVIHVGLPYISDLETLNIDLPQAETMGTKKINVTSVAIHLHETRGLFAGTKAPTGDDALEGLSEIKPRSSEPYASPAALKSGVEEVTVGGAWDSNGRIFARQVDPLPATILATLPSGQFPLRGI